MSSKLSLVQLVFMEYKEEKEVGAIKQVNNKDRGH